MKFIVNENQYSLIKNLIEGYDHPELYSDYEFDELSVSTFNNNLGGTSTNVFFNGSRNVSDEIFKYTECNKDGTCTPFIHLIGGTTEFVFPQWDASGKDIIKKSNHGDLYVTRANFEKYVKNYRLDYNESKDNNYKLSDVVSEIKKRYRFKNLMNKILAEVYKGLTNDKNKKMYGKGEDENCKTNDGVINYRGVKYGYNKALISNWSILNYFNTNSKVINYLLKLYLKESDVKLGDFKTNFVSSESAFLNWVNKNKEELFSPSSVHLDTLERLNLTTLTLGVIREQEAVKVIMKIHGVGEGSITEYCPGSREDTINGRDIKVTVGSETIYYQVKPLSGPLKQDKSEYVIYTNSMKKYPNTVDRIIFLNEKGEYYVFENKNYSVTREGGVVKFLNPPKEQS
jgi:hypothetical protein